MNTEIIVKKIESAFENNKNDPEIEVEIRLGKFNGKMFDTNVGKEVFDRIFRGLSQKRPIPKFFTEIGTVSE